jgi:dihydropteroate synthase
VLPSSTISGAAQREPAIAGVAARYGAPMVLMHNRDTIDPDIDIFDDVCASWSARSRSRPTAGVPRNQIVVDPGIGFGKTPRAEPCLLIRDLAALKELGCPILLGASRKSMIGQITGQTVAAERVAGSISSHLYGVSQGAAIIRAHDVRAHADALQVWAAIANSAA